uniref:Uncharacterized protein n=1 Tax=Anguilla anguilla TaxID=7936 RepID=A0A0E9S4C5_ANGAN
MLIVVTLVELCNVQASCHSLSGTVLRLPSSLFLLSFT